MPDYPQKMGIGVVGMNCKRDALKGFKDCESACKKGGIAAKPCNFSKGPILNDACKAFVNGSVANCMHLCKSQSLHVTKE